MASRRAVAATWTARGFVGMFLLSVGLLGAAFAFYGDDSPDPCLYEDYDGPWWVIAGMASPLANAFFWLAAAGSYLIVPGSDRPPLRAARWSVGLGVLSIPLLVLGSFVLMLMFFDCNH